MPSIDELGRDFFNALYEGRVAVAIGSVILATVAAVFAWRRGWFAAARRHPGRSSAVVAIALAIGLPLAWYLASPIFLRSSLVEAEPVAAASPTAPAPTEAPSASAPILPNPTEAPPPSTPAPTPFAPTTHATGSFVGSDEFHFGRGTATIIETSPGRYHLRLEDFSVRNGPDLFVYLSPAADGYADGALEVGKLKATDGAFGYDLPEGTVPTDFASAIIWCKQFSHLFATAPLETT